MKKRRLKEVREEIRQLDYRLTHVVISMVALKSCGKDHPDLDIERADIERQLHLLKVQYPKWEKRSKFAE